MDDRVYPYICSCSLPLSYADSPMRNMSLHIEIFVFSAVHKNTLFIRLVSFLRLSLLWRMPFFFKKNKDCFEAWDWFHFICPERILSRTTIVLNPPYCFFFWGNLTPLLLDQCNTCYWFTLEPFLTSNSQTWSSALARLSLTPINKPMARRLIRSNITQLIWMLNTSSE